MRLGSWVASTLVSNATLAGPRPNPLIVVISGPSGVGKDAIVQRIAETRTDFHFTVTATTRPPRPNEVHGVNHEFLSTERFKDMISEGELLEWAEVYGNYYGTPKKQVRDALAEGKHVLLRIDVQGAVQVMQLVPDAVSVFISAPAKSVLIDRLRNRGVNDEADIARRMAAADMEMEQARHFDYNVVNHQGRLKDAVQQVLDIVEKESMLVPPRVMNV